MIVVGLLENLYVYQSNHLSMEKWMKPEKDYVHAIYVMAIIIYLSWWVNGIFFYIVFHGASNYAYLSEGAFYIGGLVQTTAIIMILYVAYKRFIEGWKEGREKSKQ